MRVRDFAFVLFGLLGAPALCSAGPIEFHLAPTSLQVQPGTPAISAALYPILPPGTCHTFDPATGAPSVVPLVGYDPTRLGQPAPIDIHADGTTHWNNDGYFRVDYCLTDVASGESAEFSAWGRAHMYNVYGNGQWSGTTYFWFGGVQQVSLGGNDYTIWGPGSQGRYTDELPALSVWVGSNPPATLTPEPGTLVLVALGLAPLGLGVLRRGGGLRLARAGN